MEYTLKGECNYSVITYKLHETAIEERKGISERFVDVIMYA